MRNKRNLSSFNDDEYCLVITDHLESENVPTEIVDPLKKLCLETSDDSDELQVCEAPP